MNTRTHLIELFIRDLRSINAPLRDITPATVSSDIAITKITGLIKKWDAHQQYLSKVLTKGPNDVVITDEYDHATTILPDDEQDIVDNMFDSGIHNKHDNTRSEQA